MITAADLLDGPRGRRFCLELLIAAQADDDWIDGDLHSMLFWTEYHLGRSRGSGGVLFGPGADIPEPAPPVSTVAAAIDALALPEVTAAAIADTLGATADSAMAWQPHDDRDEFLRHPGLRDTLDRLAAWATGSDRVQQLFRPLAPRWTVEFVRYGAGDRAVPERPAPAEALRTWRDDLLADQRRGEPSGMSGTWWTTPPWPLEPTTGAPFPALGPLALWAVEDSFGDYQAIVRRAAGGPDDRIVRVDSPENWAALCRRWPLAVDRTTRRTDWAASTGGQATWVQPDWAAVAAEVDVVHLTVAGWFRCSGIAIAVDGDGDGDRASVVAGWTPDAAYRLTGPDPVADAGPTRWIRPDDDPWTTTAA